MQYILGKIDEFQEDKSSKNDKNNNNNYDNSNNNNKLDNVLYKIVMFQFNISFYTSFQRSPPPLSSTHQHYY